MSGLKNSPFGKRLRASRVEDDDEGPRRNRPRVNPIFGGAPPTPVLDYRTTPESGSDSPAPPRNGAPSTDYGDRFVPSRDAGDMRTTFNLLDDGAPSAPPKSKIIPTESDALKGARCLACR